MHVLIHTGTTTHTCINTHIYARARSHTHGHTLSCPMTSTLLCLLHTSHTSFLSSFRTQECVHGGPLHELLPHFCQELVSVSPSLARTGSAWELCPPRLLPLLHSFLFRS